MYQLTQRVLTIKFSKHAAALSLQHKPGGVCTHNNSCIFTAYEGAPCLKSLTGNSYLHLQSRVAYTKIVRAENKPNISHYRRKSRRTERGGTLDARVKNHGCQSKQEHQRQVLGRENFTILHLIKLFIPGTYLFK